MRPAAKQDGGKQDFPGVSHYYDRHGKPRWRYRKNGFTVSLGSEYGSPEFIRRYNAATRPEEGQSTRAIRAIPGSLGYAVEAWLGSAQFLRLADKTRSTYRATADRLRASYGDRPIAGLDRKTIKRIMAKHADRPGTANNFLRLLRIILDYACDTLDLIEISPAVRIKKLPTNNPDGFHTWSEDEIATFQKAWPEGTLADLTTALILYTGAARVDVVQLGPGNRAGDRIRYRRQKTKSRTGIVVDIPLHPELKRRLDALPPDQATYLQTRAGEQRSASGLGNMMQVWRDKAGLPECSLHGLRKAIARRLAEAGATTHEIAAVTGHRTLAEVQRYTEKVQRAGLADRAMQLAQHTLSPANAKELVRAA